MAASNFAMAIAALLIIPYTIYVEEIKGLLVRDMHCSILAIHGLSSILLSKFQISVLYLLFVGAVGSISAVIGEIGSTALEQRRLMREIFEIEREDRNSIQTSNDLHESIHLTSSIS